MPASSATCLTGLGCQFAATASGPVGLGVNANHLMMGREQCLQRGGCEFGGAGKNKSHGVLISVPL